MDVHVDSNAELKVLPTQPEHPTIPEEDDDDSSEVRERARADTDEGEGVEVSLRFMTSRRFFKKAATDTTQFYTPLSQIPAGTARRDAQKLTKSEKAKLPRVTAYCTAA